jgi:hypothetical protein
MGLEKGVLEAALQGGYGRARVAARIPLETGDGGEKKGCKSRVPRDPTRPLPPGRPPPALPCFSLPGTCQKLAPLSFAR